MDHIQFKSNQTAAAYVAHELTDQQQEAFELHMMGCSECINDVESWRVIKTHMPAPAVHRGAEAVPENCGGVAGAWRPRSSAPWACSALGGWFASSAAAAEPGFQRDCDFQHAGAHARRR